MVTSAAITDIDSAKSDIDDSPSEAILSKTENGDLMPLESAVHYR